MSTIIKSRVVIIYVLASLLLSVVLLSEGYTVAGIVILCALLALFFVYLMVFGLDISPAESPSANYEKQSLCQWLYTRTSFITDQSVLMISFRALVLMICIFISIQGLLINNLPFFADEVIFNKLLYVSLLAFALLYLMFGMRFCAVPAFGVFLTIMASYYSHLLMHTFFLSELQHNLISYALITFYFSIGAFILMHNMRKELCYYDFQQYERGGKIYVADLYLGNFNLAEKYGNLSVYSVSRGEMQVFLSSENIQHELFFIARSHGFFFAGAEIYEGKEQADLCFYGGTDAASEPFNITLLRFLRESGSELLSATEAADADWDKYKKTLYPKNHELCEINSRNHLQALFAKGTSFNSEYEISFYINFRNKQDPVDFENIIGYFGFSLIYASYDEIEQGMNSAYKYCGEYRISSYISPRRLEHLNNLLLYEAEGFGCVYLGEWQIEA